MKAPALTPTPYRVCLLVGGKSRGRQTHGLPHAAHPHAALPGCSLPLLPTAAPYRCSLPRLIPLLPAPAPTTHTIC